METTTRTAQAQAQAHYRLVGALNRMPDHHMVITEAAKPTITGSIRACPDVPKDIKRRYCHLEVQDVRGDYGVVDSWSDGTAQDARQVA